jgi:hypothetical protein
MVMNLIGFPTADRVIKCGDRATFTNISQRNGVWRFSTREGTVTRVTTVDSRLRLRNGRNRWVLNPDLRLASEPSELTELVRRL